MQRYWLTKFMHCRFLPFVAALLVIRAAGLSLSLYAYFMCVFRPLHHLRLLWPLCVRWAPLLVRCLRRRLAGRHAIAAGIPTTSPLFFRPVLGRIGLFMVNRVRGGRTLCNKITLNSTTVSRDLLKNSFTESSSSQPQILISRGLGYAFLSNNKALC